MSAAATLFEQPPPIPDRDELVSEWQEQGFANLPFGLGKAACQELFAHFKNFADLCAEPDGKKFERAVTYDVNGLGNGVYYFRYRQPGTVNPDEPDRPPGTDHKIKMHYGPQTIERAKSYLGGALPADMSEFLDASDEAYNEARRTLKIGTGLLGLEKVFLTPNRNEDVNHLCLLDYMPSDEEWLAEPHFDRGVFTIALSESSEGLRGAAGQWPTTVEQLEALRQKLSPIEHVEHVAKIFGGAGMNHLPRHLREYAPVPFLAHDVENIPGQSRQSVVLFSNPHQLFTGYRTVPDEFETGFGKILEKIQEAV